MSQTSRRFLGLLVPLLVVGGGCQGSPKERMVIEVDAGTRPYWEYQQGGSGRLPATDAVGVGDAPPRGEINPNDIRGSYNITDPNRPSIGGGATPPTPDAGSLLR